MSWIRKGFYLSLGLSLLLFSVPLSLAQLNRSERKSEASSAEGRNTFNSSCAGCHGLDGKGSDKAVNISSSARVRRFSDAELSGIIVNGVPGTGMPAFHTLSERQVRAIVGYVRLLQGGRQAATLPGDATRGKEIFFGKGECSSCHAVSGQGGFLGPDLSGYGSIASEKIIRDEIIKSQRTPTAGFVPAVITTADGERLEGLIRNEDNFSVQFQTKDGDFHFFSKSDLRNLDRLETSLMPTNYGESLSPGELNDLISYLMTTTPDASRPTPRKKEDDAE